MQGGSARPPQQPRSQPAPDDPPAAADWYAVAADGASALRIVAGLALGVSESGALALNDPNPGNQWIEFDLGDHGEPSVAVVTRDKSLVVDGITRMRQRLSAGATLELPGNTLYISRNISLPSPSGPVLEVVPREVPDRPQDLVAPGWEEALEAVSRADARPPAGTGSPAGADPPADGDAPADPAHAAPAATPPEADAGVRDDEAGPGSSEGTAFDPETELHTADVPVADSRPDQGTVTAEPRRQRTRRRRRSGRNNLMLSAAVGVMVAAGAVALLVAVGWLETAEVTPGDAEPGVASDMPGRPATGEPPPEASGDVPLEVGRRPDPGSRSADATVPDDAGSAEPAPVADLEQGSSSAAGPADSSAAGTVSAAADGELRGSEAGQEQPAEGVAPLRENEAARAESLDLDWRVIRARELMDAGYITYPPEDNAVAYLERLLAADPDNPRARAMLDEATRELIDAAVRAHDQGLDYQARNTLEEVFGFNPDNERAHRLWRAWVGTIRGTPAER